MRGKTFLLIGGLVLALAGLFAAGGRRFWKHGSPLAEPRVVQAERDYPPAADEYQKIMRCFSTRDSNINIWGNIRIYDGENKYALKEQRTFAFIRYGDQFYSQISRLQTYCDGSLILLLDTLKKTMVVSEAPTKMNGNVDPVSQSIGHLFSDTAKFRIYATVSREGADGVLKMKSDLRPEMKSCTLFYDTTSYRLLRSEIAWWKQPVLTKTGPKDGIWLSKLDYHFENPHPLDIHKKIEAMILVKGDKVNPRPMYKDYHVISQLHRDR